MHLSFQGRRSHRPRNRGAYTLVELMIAVSLGALIVGSMTGVFVLLNRGLNAMGNYEELDRQSRYALDCMSRDIREAGGLTNFTTSTLWFTNMDNSLLKYDWDTNQHCLFCYNNNTTNLLLSNCVSLQFTIYQRTPSNGTTMVFFPLNTNSASKAKVIVVNWACQRTNYATQVNSESVQTAKIVMRN